MAADGGSTKSPEDENRELKEKNNALVQKVQHWKVLAAQREDEKIDLMKELNELRLSLSHYRSRNTALDVALDAAIQEFGQTSLTRLVEVSSSITRTVEVLKTYIRNKQEVESLSPASKQSMWDSPRDRGSSKVWPVAPMIRGSTIIKPTIRLRPIDAVLAQRQAVHLSGDDSSNTSSEARTPPPHALPDLYIPLRRIDAELDLDSVNVALRSRALAAELTSDELTLDVTLSDGDDGEDSEVDVGMDGELAAEGERGTGEGSEHTEDYNAMRGLDPLPEETEEENWSPQVILSRQLPVERRYPENPLEGPSWLLDRRQRASSTPVTPPSNGLEADSTTDAAAPPRADGPPPATPPASAVLTPPPPHQARTAESPARAFTPTRRVRRRRARLSSPRLSLALVDQPWAQPEPVTSRRDGVRRRDQDPTKVLVLVSKMRLEGAGGAAGSSTPAGRARAPLEAPSPNGSTQDAGPIVMDSPNTPIDSCTLPLHPDTQSIAANSSRRESSETHRADLDAPTAHVTARSSSLAHRPQRTERDRPGHLRECERDESEHVSRRESAVLPASVRPDRTASVRETAALQTSNEPHPTENDSSTSRRSRQKSTAAGGSRRERERESAVAGGDSSVAHGSRESSARGGREGSAGSVQGSSESEGEGEGRAKRRRREQISYKEKPLNRKLRR